MLTVRRLVAALSFVLISVSIAAAQEEKTTAVQPATPIITAAASTDGVRFAALTEATEMRLEIYSANGEIIFDSGFRKGALLDWQPQDTKSPLEDGAYLCLITYRDLQSRLRQKMGALLIESGRIALRRLSAGQLTATQAQALAASRTAQPITTAGGDEALTILPTEALPLTIATHDGEDGRVISTQGGLSFRTGDFFSGNDRERMRITTDGRVGIGTDKPETMFDVAGAIRARGGIIFNDGTALTSAGTAGRVNKSGAVVPNATGTGTQNFIAKWQETGGAGTLGDSGIFEAPNGFIGIGTTTPPHPFSVRRNGGTLGVHSVGELFVDRDNNSRSASLTVGTAGTLKWIFGMPSGTDGFQIFDLLATPAPGQSRFFVDPNNGNVGIGTTAPGQKLDVAGNISATGHVNTFTQYNINGNNRVLSVPGTSNLFVGINSGNLGTMGGLNTFVGTSVGYSNTTGIANSFFGHLVGVANTTGSYNSFFGENTGVANIAGEFNSFYGYMAGAANTNGISNSFFGANAGRTNTTGSLNSFFGRDAGYSNTTGGSNSFFGWSTGYSNSTGSANSFFGRDAGRLNTTGTDNSFFGSGAGRSNMTGDKNSFFGVSAGFTNSEGNNNSFFGWSAGYVNTTGTNNSFFGWTAGYSNSTGSNNSFFGREAGRSNRAGSDNSFFGRNAGDANTDGTSNSFFGSNTGLSNTTGGGNSFFGLSAGNLNTEGSDNSFVGRSAGFSNTTGGNNSFFGRSAGLLNTTGSNNTIIGWAANVGSSNLTYATAVGAEAVVSDSNSVVLGRSAGQDTVRIPGNLIVTGTVSKGGGSFKIDHPLDPANKTLSHSFVESPDMMNIYNGNVTLDARGRATVKLPAYFEALNMEFRYQLTPIGAPGPNLYIAAEIKGNQFKIAGGRPRMKVSWQVTGTRHDAFANANRIPVEEDKPEVERGTYLHPGAFSQTEDKGIKQATEVRPLRRTKVVRMKRPPATR